MWEFNLLAATRTVEAAMPFMLYRLAVCLGVALACVFAAMVGAGTLIAFASFSSKPGSVAGLGAVLGLAGLAFILYKFRAGLFFNIKAGHLALLASLARGEKLPQGKAQIDLAKEKASQCFPTPSSFQEANQAVTEVLRELPPKHCPFLKHLANQELAKVLGILAGRLLQTADQALLALCFSGDGNAWKSVRDGLIVHVRHFDPLSKNRLYLLAFEYLGLIAAYFLMLYPVDSVVSLLPVGVGVWRYVFALIFAWSLKSAFLEPIATTALAEIYFKLAQQEVDGGEAETGELEAESLAFRKISANANPMF